MNRDELKQKYSMRDIVEQYGFTPNRAGFIHCPFHKGDKGASLKVYKDSFHCFGCGANGDIFTFIQKMDSVDFKTAFQSLGGTYDKPTFAVLCECGFIDCDKDNDIFDTVAEQKAFGVAYAKAILEYLGIAYQEERPVEVSGDKLYRVQVGAYKVKSNAEAMLARLKEAGFEGFITY